METVVQVIGYGVIIGALFGLVGLGIGLINGITKFLNVAHGSFIILGGYIAYWLFTLLGIDPYLSIPLVVVATFITGLALFRFTLSPLLKLPDIGMRINNSLLITFGVIYFLDNVMTLVWTPNVRTVVTSYSGSGVNVFGTYLSVSGLYGVGTAVIVAIALYFILERTPFGKHVRAATQDADAATLCGINIRLTYLVSSGIAVALAGIAGVVIITSYSITPGGGLSWLLTGLIVMVLAGEGNINGIIPAGIILGLIESASVLFIGPSYQQAIGLAIFILILMFRPQGLFGKGS